MADRVYALLVGIDQYPPEVGALNGCVNDVQALADWLRGSGDPRPLALAQLVNAEATRDNLVRQFREHLGQARAGDVALFHYSGHGARWAAAPAFLPWYPEGKDEGLVCIDSRRPGGFDLADKELALLVQELAGRGVHVAVSLDCCHAGSGTRHADAFRGLRTRATHERSDARPLESYLDGQYSSLLARGEALRLPAARHILLAACERTQQAKETPDGHGVYTATLLDVLARSGGALSYAELFVRCRDRVRQLADDQLPQFETHGHFDAWAGFLGRALARAPRRFSVVFEQAAWQVDAGAVHGLPTDAERPAELTLYPEDADTAAGTARVESVGPQRSVLALDFAAPASARFRAELRSLPVPPLPVWAEPGSAEAEALAAALAQDASTGVALSADRAGAVCRVQRRGDRLVVLEPGQDEPLQAVRFDPARPAAAMPPLLAVLEQVAHWTRQLGLGHPGTRLDTGAVELVCSTAAAAGLPAEQQAGPVALLESLPEPPDGEYRWSAVQALLQARNRSGRPLHLLLLHFSADYGIRALFNEPVPSGEAWVTLYGDQPDQQFWIDDRATEAIDRFKLVVSTSRVDHPLLTQPDLQRGRLREALRGIGGERPPGRKRADDWFTRDLTVRTVGRLDQVGPRDWVSAGGRLTVKGHPALKAAIHLSAPPVAGRGVAAGLPFEPAFQRAGLRWLNLGGSRDSAASVLELTGITGGERLREQPLELVLDVPLAEHEAILPFVFDGAHVLPGGQPARDEAGRTHVRIDHLPELPAERRSLGKALKLYFFKTWLKRPEVNRLCWVEALPDGSVRRHDDGVADRVARARRVLLLVHGIIGDTEGMARGVQASGVAGRFDLVLTYDYENLATPIADTARALRDALAAAGLGPDDDRHLTLLVHSMGGLVSRWFIEREGGQAVVDHLVMCGTPNAGSPFGKVAGARGIATMLLGLAANVAPAALPFAAPLALAVNRSERLTPTLEQMHPDSALLRELNAAPAPPVRYTVLGGDVDQYQEPSDPLFDRLVTRLGQGVLVDALFGRQPNDIAVAVDSIFGGGAGRPGVDHRPVACHHLNYFSARTGLAALQAVDW